MIGNKNIYFFMIAVLVLVSTEIVLARDPPTSWNSAKNIMDDFVYSDYKITFYCGCKFISHEDSDGSGNISNEFRLIPKKNHQDRANRVEWEHVVPKSYLLSEDSKTDLHNLVPSIGQINAFRSNGKYGMASKIEGADSWEGCPGVYDTGGSAAGINYVFETADESKPMVARISMYMYEKYGLPISQEQRNLFINWCNMEKPSEWEETRNSRIREKQGDSNQFVETGSCDWLSSATNSIP